MDKIYMSNEKDSDGEIDTVANDVLENFPVEKLKELPAEPVQKEIKDKGVLYAKEQYQKELLKNKSYKIISELKNNTSPHLQPITKCHKRELTMGEFKDDLFTVYNEMGGAGYLKTWAKSNDRNYWRMLELLRTFFPKTLTLEAPGLENIADAILNKMYGVTTGDIDLNKIDEYKRAGKEFKQLEEKCNQLNLPSPTQAQNSKNH